MFIDYFPGVKQYVENCDEKSAASVFRNKDIGGLLYFRPVALPQLIKAIFEIHIRSGVELDEVIKNLSQIEMCISKEPWTNFLWDTKTQTMVMKYKTSILYMLLYLYNKELLAPKEMGTLIKKYAEANDFDIDKAKQKLINIHSIL